MKKKKWRKTKVAKDFYSWEYQDKKLNLCFCIAFDGSGSQPVVEIASFLGSEELYIAEIKENCDLKTFEQRYLEPYKNRLLRDTKWELENIIDSL